MNKGKPRRSREKKIQRLIRDHPYLLDKDLMDVRGRMERSVANGRLDVDFETEDGWVIVECKVTALTNKDLRQLCGYIEAFEALGKRVRRGYLVGGRPIATLDPGPIGQRPIAVVHLISAIPDLLAMCERRHYFDAALERCPFDGCPPIPGELLELTF